MPENEKAFLHDQKTARLMFIGGIDQITSIKLKKRRDRQLVDNARKRRHGAEMYSVKYSDNSHLCDSNESPDDTSSEIAFGDMQATTGSTSQLHRQNNQMRVKLPKLAKLCDRYGVSDRAGAAIATAVLEDFGIVSNSIADKVDVKCNAIFRQLQ